MNKTSSMKEMWNQRARKDAFYYVESAFWDGNIEKFFNLGEQRTQLILDPVLKDADIDVQNSHILEIGCGVGRFSRALSQRFQQVTAIDISEAMLDQARALHPCSAYPNLTFRSTDGTSMDFVPSSSVDVVFSYEVFQHLPSADVILKNLEEICRVLRPSGIAYIHLMTDRGKFRKTMKNFLKRFIPSFIWQAFGFTPLTFDKTWTGISLSPEHIQNYCRLANLKFIKLVDDPTHSSGDRMFLLTTPMKGSVTPMSSLW